MKETHEIGKYDWVVQSLFVVRYACTHCVALAPHCHFPRLVEEIRMATEEDSALIDCVWETIYLNRREDSLKGRYKMKPRSLKAAIGTWRRRIQSLWEVDCYFVSRLYNKTTGEVIPANIL